MVLHIILGAFSNVYPTLDVYFFIWQIFQFIIGKRIFLWEQVYSPNSLQHTLRKFLEYYVGKFMFDKLYGFYPKLKV